jgi:hypothetical protein
MLLQGTTRGEVAWENCLIRTSKQRPLMRYNACTCEFHPTIANFMTDNFAHVDDPGISRLLRQEDARKRSVAVHKNEACTSKRPSFRNHSRASASSYVSKTLHKPKTLNPKPQKRGAFSGRKSACSILRGGKPQKSPFFWACGADPHLPFPVNFASTSTHKLTIDLKCIQS